MNREKKNENKIEVVQEKENNSTWWKPSNLKYDDFNSDSQENT